jgi:ATP adenylyltransferase
VNQLWAPWRMELVSKGEPPSGGCIFCDLPRGADDRSNLILGRTEHTFAILNRFPYNNGHLMVVPRVHQSDLDRLADAEWAELGEMLRVADRIVRKAYGPHGTNLGMNLGRVAGAGIADHLHWHIVPRWNGDTNFMPVIAETKVMVEHLDALWEKLRPLFDSMYSRVKSW